MSDLTLPEDQPSALVCEDCGGLIRTDHPHHQGFGEVYWPATGEGPYMFCSMCVHHSTKNRGGTLITTPGLADLWRRFDLAYKRGTLTHVNGERMECLRIPDMILLIHALAKAVPSKKAEKPYD